MVRAAGLEPARAEAHQLGKPSTRKGFPKMARLPIPPRPQAVFMVAY